MSRTPTQTSAWPSCGGIQGLLGLIMPLAGVIAARIGQAVGHEPTGGIGKPAGLAAGRRLGEVHAAEELESGGRVRTETAA